MTIKLQDIYGLAAVDIGGPITAFDATAAYVVNDIVTEGGFIYRAISAITPGVFDKSEWEEISYKKPDTSSISFVIKGGIMGGTIKYLDADTVTVTAFSCKGDDFSTNLFINTDSNLDIAAPANNQLYHIFAVKYNDGSGDANNMGLLTDTDQHGANLPASVSAKRWLGFCLTNASGAILSFVYSGSTFSFTTPHQLSPILAGGSPFSANSVDMTAIFPSLYTTAVFYVFYANANGRGAAISLDGTTESASGGIYGNGIRPLLFAAYTDTVWFKSTAGGTVWGGVTTATIER